MQDHHPSPDALPESLPEPTPVPAHTAVMLASGDARLSANVLCWPAQQTVERQVTEAFRACGWQIQRGSPAEGTAAEPHGFIHSQQHGRDVFASIHPDAPLVIVEAVWQYSAHALIGLLRHRGPILVACNFSGQWPGLVGALNLRGSLTKAGVEHALLWSEDFSDHWTRGKLDEWCRTGRIQHDISHAVRLDPETLPAMERALGETLATELRRRPAIMGVFDEGCMGMFNAIVPDHLLNPTGVFKERLSQSLLYARMRQVPDADAIAVRAWIDAEGMTFDLGPDADQLDEAQIIEQCRMYVAALRLADEYGCDLIGIQYQLGLTELCVASDLVEGLLNCSHRPPVDAMDGPRRGEEILAGRPLPHFNEVDECAGLDALITDRVWRRLGMPPDNTLHDVRWADRDHSGHLSGRHSEEIWIFEISGAVPPSHLVGGYRGARGFRQPAMYFAAGGSGIRGQSRAGVVVWSRIYVARDHLEMDLGLLDAVELPAAEMERRWNATTRQWPIMNAILRGVRRDQLMAKHQSNHIQVVYAADDTTAKSALSAKASMAHAMGIQVNLCGITIHSRAFRSHDRVFTPFFL